VAEGSPPKVAMIGLDAAELTFIQRHLSSLPALGAILASGTLQRLRSTAGVFPGSVWPTFYTGLMPGDHGVYHHLQWDSEVMQLRRVSDEWLYLEPFWYQLERRGFRVATIDVPMSFPPRLTQGAEIINWGSHDELGPFRAYPRRLAADVRRGFGRHPMGSEIPVRKSSAQLDRIRRRLVAGAGIKGDLSRWLLAQDRWDFFLTVFGETHRGGHLLWPQDDQPSAEDALLDVYRAVDRSIGQFLEVIPQAITTLIVFSLHGMGRNDSQEHFMPRFMDRVNSGFLGNGAGVSTGPDLLKGQRGGMRMLRERVPAALQNAIARAVPVHVRDFVVNRQVSAGHDWSRTPGIALLADLNGYLRWNLRGREKQGMLDPAGDGIERYTAWVQRCLTELQEPATDAPVVREVLFSRDHFPGRRMNHLPDAVVTWTGALPASRVRSPAIGDLMSEPATGRTGNHRSDGFCVIIDRTNGRGKRLPRPAHISELSSFVAACLGS
jgi:predicted AlkP superfamily phosphohydrolase/phosphomutase